MAKENSVKFFPVIGARAIRVETVKNGKLTITYEKL